MAFHLFLGWNTVFWGITAIGLWEFLHCLSGPLGRRVFRVSSTIGRGGVLFVSRLFSRRGHGGESTWEPEDVEGIFPENQQDFVPMNSNPHNRNPPNMSATPVTPSRLRNNWLSRRILDRYNRLRGRAPSSPDSHEMEVQVEVHPTPPKRDPPPLPPRTFTNSTGTPRSPDVLTPSDSAHENSEVADNEQGGSLRMIAPVPTRNGNYA